MITENGLSNTDWVASDGAVHDPQRIDYTRRYLLQLKRAMDEGAKVAGYFHWSLLDNMEGQGGYKERFGLVHVDFATEKRTLKDSARWYSRVIETNGDFLTVDVAYPKQRWYTIEPDTLAVKGLIEKVDLAKVDEVGFVDLAPAGGHGQSGWVNISTIEVYAKPVAR